MIAVFVAVVVLGIALAVLLWNRGVRP